MNSDGDDTTDPYDDCIEVAGNSTIDQIGCPDSDGDGVSDDNDSFPSDPNEWNDSDGDGIGDNQDDCPNIAGNSTNDTVGCRDTDGDGWSDDADAFPTDPDEHQDSDGDGFGDNSDDCPYEPGPVNGCPEETGNETNGTGNGTNNTHNGTNGTGNETNGTGNETNGTGNETDPGNGTGNNETGNETGNNGTGTNGTNNTGGNDTNGTGENATGGPDNESGPGPEEVPDPPSNNSTSPNGSVDDQKEQAPIIPIAFATLTVATALSIAAFGAFSTRRKRQRQTIEVGPQFGSHPTLVLNDEPAFETYLPEMD
jgi:hypothetical protein